MNSRVTTKLFAKLHVALAAHEYPIYLGEGLLTERSLWQRHLPSKQVMIVTNDTLAAHYLKPLQDALIDYHCDVHIIPDGEAHKTIATWEGILTALLTNKHDRGTTLIALGGGVVGDMTGFAAACYQRGVRFVQVPTTLLAQVDASVGGKTAVNHPLAKNMIGAFHQPAAVIIDLATLSTLPEREYLAGMAEVVKYGLIADPDFYAWLLSNVPALLERQPKALLYAIERSCAIKARIVAADEREQTGMRALLNLGHTFGHAVEQVLGYGQWLHGEAVAVGLLLAARYSELAGWLSASDVSELSNLLLALGLPIRLPNGLQCNQLLGAMALDKKVQQGQLRLVLLKSIGDARLVTDVDDAQVERVLREFS